MEALSGFDKEARLGVDEVSSYLEQVLHSPRFRRAHSLVHLLRYLVTHSVADGGSSLKESVIGIEVFGRASDFDCRIDTIVRVQAHRLRKLLETYYAEEGKGDRYRIVLPRGSYVTKVLEAGASDSAVAAALETDTPTVELDRAIVEHVTAAPVIVEKDPHFLRNWWITAAAFCLGGASVYFIGNATGNRAQAAHVAARPAIESLRTGLLSGLWGSFLDSKTEAVVVFTNPAFLRNEKHRLYVPYDGPINAPSGARLDLSPGDPHSKRGMSPSPSWFFSDGWTGTGEVLAVNKLTRMFTEAGSTLKVRRSRTFTYEELRNKNAIFVGSAWGNPIMKQIPVSGKLPFRENAVLSNQVISNLAPRGGEESRYEQLRDENTKEIITSYCLFSLLPGLSPGTKIASSAGMSTHSSWAAIDLLSSSRGIASLAAKLGSPSKVPDYFQAVVKTTVVNGEATDSQVVAARGIEAQR